MDQIKVIALGAIHYNQEINEITAEIEEHLRKELSLENQKKLDDLKEQCNRKKEAVGQNMVLTSNVFSHIKTEDLKERIGPTNKEFSYRAIFTLFSRNDTASRNLQKAFLSRIFLFPRESILTILKSWNLEKYQKLITSIIESLEHLLPHDDFKKAIFTRIFSEKNVLNDEEFKMFFKNSTTESLKYLSFLFVDQHNFITSVWRIGRDLFSIVI